MTPHWMDGPYRSHEGQSQPTVREYVDEDPFPCVVEGSKLIRGMVIKLPPVEQPSGVAARIFNTYRPILSVAKLCGDSNFQSLMVDRLTLGTAEFKEAQIRRPNLTA